MADKDALERLSTKLDSKNTGEEVHRTILHESNIRAPHEWKPDPHPVMKGRMRLKPLELVFAVSVTFFIISIAVASLLLFSGNNTVSTKNVDLEVTGPTEIGAGNTVTLQVVVTNRNAVPMELSDLVIEFPPGTRSDADVTVELPRIRESLGTIESGESINRTIRAIAFGESDTDFEVKASVEYRVPSSNAVFVAENTYIAKITQSPASIVIDTVKEAISGQDVTITATVASNAPHTLDAMLLLAEYPPGFTFLSSSPTPLTGTAVWNLGDIEKGGTRTVTIRGRFSGEDGDLRVIHFETGNQKVGQEDEIAAPLSTTEIAMLIKKPFLSVDLELDGRVSGEHSVERGKVASGIINWSNNLPVRVQDVEIVLTMKGSILDRNKVLTANGFYRSTDTSIIWSKESDPRLADIEPGESGTAVFSFATLPPDVGSFKNPELALEVTVRARRTAESGVAETISSSAATRVVVATNLDLFATLSRGGPFTSTGPYPPQADKESTYTATWLVKNSVNAVANVSVTAVLPGYVKWTGNVSPTNESIAFNPVGSIVTWQIGDIPAGGTKTVSFQVAITPSLSQVGSTPTVVGDQRIYGIDRFVRSPVERSVAPLTTQSAATTPTLGPVVP